MFEFFAPGHERYGWTHGIAEHGRGRTGAPVMGRDDQVTPRQPPPDEIQDAVSFTVRRQKTPRLSHADDERQRAVVVRLGTIRARGRDARDLARGFQKDRVACTHDLASNARALRGSAHAPGDGRAVRSHQSIHRNTLQNSRDRIPVIGVIVRPDDRIEMTHPERVKCGQDDSVRELALATGTRIDEDGVRSRPQERTLPMTHIQHRERDALRFVRRRESCGPDRDRNGSENQTPARMRADYAEC